MGRTVVDLWSLAMPTTLVDLGQLQGDVAGLAASIASFGTGILVANTNSKQAQSSNGYKNPYAILAGTATNHANVVSPIRVPPACSHVELYHAYDINSGTPGDPATQPVVRVYGRVPEVTPVRSWPEDQDSTNFASTSTYGFWIPCVKPSDNTGSQAFVAHTLWHGDASKPYGIAGPLVFLVAGVTQIIVTVETAGDPATAGIILARFSS
jgi:hypothetical protein